jgi:hypothetical protein
VALSDDWNIADTRPARARQRGQFVSFKYDARQRIASRQRGQCW